MSAGAHNDPHFTDLAAMGLPSERGQNAFGILRQPPKPIAEPAPKRVYIQMTKAQKSASAFMTAEERKAWREQMAQPKASSFNTQIPDQKATDRSNSIARTK
jgi:hypothetical protein